MPEHAWDVDSVTPLFDPFMLIDGIDDEVRSEEETGCLRLWVWMDSVEKLKTRGILQLEEPREAGSPGAHYPELNIMEEAAPRWGKVGMLGHPVLIHLDHVVDFSCPPASSPDSGMSIDSGISGLPSDDGTVPEWPGRWGYRWFLSYEDGDFLPPPPRQPARSRLRFPDAGGDGGGGRRRTYGSREGFLQASTGLRHAGADRQHQEGRSRGAGHDGGGRRHSGRPAGGDPPLIDTAAVDVGLPGVDPFFRSVDAPMLFDQRHGDAENADQEGKGAGNRRRWWQTRIALPVKV